MCNVRVYTHINAQIHTLYRVCVFVLGEHTVCHSPRTHKHSNTHFTGCVLGERTVCHSSNHTKKWVRGTVGLALVTCLLVSPSQCFNYCRESETAQIETRDEILPSFTYQN